MTRRFAHATAVVLTTLSTPALASTVYVAGEKGGSITVVDSKSGATMRFDIPIEPHNVDITANGARLLATGSGKAADHGNHQSGSGGQLVVMDLKTPAPEIISISLGDIRLMSCQIARGVSPTSAMAPTTLSWWSTFQPARRLAEEGRLLAVVNMRSGDVSFVDVGTRKVLGTFAVGRSPVQVGLDPSGRHLAVSLNGENRVAIVDVAVRKVLWKTDVGHGPVQVSFTTDGQIILVADQGSASNPADRLSRLAKARTAPLSPKTGRQPT